MTEYAYKTIFPLTKPVVDKPFINLPAKIYNDIMEGNIKVHFPFYVTWISISVENLMN